MLFDLGRWKTIKGLRLSRRRGALFGLPIAIGLVRQYSKRCQAAVGQGFTAVFAGFFTAHQQAHGPGSQGSATSTGEQTAKATTAPRLANGRLA
ncbi:hypothetical protein D3C76_1375590 [compost metagenome]